jgi:hypothetical protein
MRVCKKPIEPQIILLRPNTRNAYSIKIASANMPATVEAIRKIWSDYFPNDPFNYTFLTNHITSSIGPMHCMERSLAYSHRSPY